MKRLFSICLLSLACALLASAQVAFLEYKSSASMTNGADYSEKAAYDWFVATYGSDNVVDMSNIPSDASTYKVLWINIDDNGSGDLPAAFLDVKTDIETYVKAGGNLLLTKRAARIATEIGRLTRTTSVKYYPDDSEYADPVRNYVNARLGTSVQERNASKHPIFDKVPLNNSEEGHYLLSSTTPGKSYIWTEMERVDGKSRAENNTIDHLNEFQEGWNCQVLAVWGNVTDFCGPVIVEFFPKGDYKGSIISIGTRSYVWGSNNSNIANVEKLTSNALNYLAAGGNTYGYVMPYTLSELYSLSGDDGTYKPDYEAAKWFYDNYIVTNKGRFIHKEEAIPTGMKVLWVNNDRSAFTDRETFYNDLGGSTFKDALESFVKSGGNVFLTMQATRLANDIGRVSVAPEYRMNGWQGKDDNTRYMTADFYALKDGSENRVGLDRHTHLVYKYMPNAAYVTHNEGGVNVYCKWQLMDFTDANKRTDNNAIWENHWDGYADAVHLARATKFEEDHHCVILGGYGHSTALDGVGFVEFYPYGDYNGTVIALGLHSYEWGLNNRLVANVQNLTQGVLYYLSCSVVTKPETKIPNPVYNLIIHQGGSISNTENIVVENSITYIRPAVGGAASNELGQWYTFCLPFTPTGIKVHDEDDGSDYAINSVYLNNAVGEKSDNPQGSGHFYLQTFNEYENGNTHWEYIGNEGIPYKDTPYIIKFIDDAEDAEKGNPGLASYFTDNPVIKFIGGAQEISGTHDETGGEGAGDFTFHVNKTLRKLTLSGIYPLNIETNMFEYDYGDESTIMPFECYIKASTPARALASPRLALRPRGSKEQTEIATSMDHIADSTAQTQKILYNGQVVIVRDNKMYNVLGQEL